MGRESSHGRKELFNLPPLVLRARAPNDGSAFCIGFSRLEVPEQTLGGIPLGLGMVMKINFFEFSCIGLHLSLGMFDRLWTLLEDACTELDLRMAKPDHSEGGVGSSTFNCSQAASLNFQ